MYRIIRDAPFGQLSRFITGNRVFKYPEELPDFQCPHGYIDELSANNDKKTETQHEDAALAESTEVSNEAVEEIATPLSTDVEKAEPNSSDDESLKPVKTTNSTMHRTSTLPWTPERLRADEILALEKAKSRPIEPLRTLEDTILVDWYATDDQDNPQNWSQKKKAWAAFLIDLYTFIVYASSSIYVSSELLIMQRFGVHEFKAALGLALYCLGYGMGPLIFAPMSEVPLFGRNIPYITTFALFTILALPTSLVDNFGGLLVLRFLLGFFGSPCLANGGASLGDMYSLLYLPYSIAAWVSAMFAAPALGPLLSGFAVYAKNWRWSQWEVLWMAGPVFLLFFFFLPETQPATILLQRAARLRKVTGKSNIRSQTEIDRKDLTFGDIITDAIIKPIEICVKDPAIMFVNLYTALTYGIYYSFFEVFPLVYSGIYGFNVGETGIVFICIVVACIIAVCIHFTYLSTYLVPDILKNGMRAQEHRLVPAIYASFGPPIGLFLFGWTARASIHWFVSIIGITIYAGSCFILLQCIFTYVPMSYPQYAASLFAGNDFARSLFAFGAVLFSRPMYMNLGVAKGISLLGGLSVMGIFGMFGLYFYGAKLRARSKFAI
ncbi:multidrug transporter [Dendryphion nanum]|uniref:Multidrug transporter n=1 Tax=Dendryphion nanum TaxID=256645 RepID=A0A9P9CXW5_9PLEO|nr:multidrug transporter [Dendryphion nanum]